MATIPSSDHQTCEHQATWGGSAEGVTLKNCDRPKQMKCGRCGDRLYVVRCGTANERACPPCANTYRRRVAVVAQSGITLVRKGQFIFLTFTAPSDKGPHEYRGMRCPCTPDHSESVDPESGEVVEVPGIDLATWNGEAVHRWNRLRQAIERKWGVSVSYFKATEVQERGALHLHVVARLDRQVVIRKSALRALAIRHGFGHSVDIQPIGNPEGAGHYVAKYVTKAATERKRVPYLHRRTGERGPGRWRTWTASRDWGWTMAEVKAAQVAWMIDQRAGAGGEGRSPDAGALDHKTSRYASTVPATASTVTV
jgi:hypothetical protein